MHLFLFVALLAAPLDAGSTAPPPAAPKPVSFDYDARVGAISILPHYPWDRSEPYRRNDPQCLRDRHAWLVEQVGLKPGLAF
jgi:hypothetical protein